MTLAPMREYHNPSASNAPLSCDVPHNRLAILEAVGNRELPDARLTAADRRFVKRALAALEPRLSYEALMFLSCASEDAARRKRSLEGRTA